jgi:hypothetical protein
MHLEDKSFSYPEPFLRAFDRARRGALAKSITGYHKNMVRKQYPVLELANQMPVRIWIWPEPLAAPRVRRLAIYTKYNFCKQSKFCKTL